jgi:hypothetical protein
MNAVTVVLLTTNDVNSETVSGWSRVGLATADEEDCLAEARARQIR